MPCMPSSTPAAAHPRGAARGGRRHSRPRSGRHIHLVLENDDNAARSLIRAEGRRRGFYRAQWNDDYHHALARAVDAASAPTITATIRMPASASRRALAEGFAYQGEPSPFRGGKKRGEPSAQLPRAAFVEFRAEPRPDRQPRAWASADGAGEARGARSRARRALAQPGPPLLFMGEEWGAREPFLFFCDFKGDLAEAVRKGRRREYAEFYAEYGDEIPTRLRRKRAIAPCSIGTPARGLNMPRASRLRVRCWRCATVDRTADPCDDRAGRGPFRFRPSCRALGTRAQRR